MIWEPLPRSDIGSLQAASSGQGPLVLLIHGVGLRAEAWTLQIAALAPRFRVSAIDLPGHGGSGRLSGSLDLAAYTDTVAGALETPALVIGHSMGAMIALDLAARFPKMVRGVVALNAIFERSPQAQAAVLSRASSLDGLTTPDPTGTLTRWFGASASPERRACEAWLTSVDPAGYCAAYQTFAAEDGPARSALAGLACPALFLTGSEEPNSTPAMSKAMADLAPNGRAQIIEGAAHMMPMTHADAVNEALLSFADQVFDAETDWS